MRSPRLAKILGDLKVFQGRILLVVLALGVSLLLLTTVLGSQSILSREITTNYMSTNPADATFKIDPLDKSLAMDAGSLPGVEASRSGRTVRTKAALANNQTGTLLLFGTLDWSKASVAKVMLEKGTWPAAPLDLALERSTLDFYGLKVGDSLKVTTDQGVEKTLTITAQVHDPSLAPSWQEKTGDGYVGPQTLEALGLGTYFDEIKIVFKDKTLSEDRLRDAVIEVGKAFQGWGAVIHGAQVPPRFTHPHAGQMTTLLTLFAIFGFLGLILSALLASTLLASLLAKERRNIGIMKTLGSSEKTLVSMYLTYGGLMGVLALLWSFPLGLICAGALSQGFAELLNFQVFNSAPAFWVWPAVLGSGISIPLILSLIPVVRAVKETVKASISGEDSTQSPKTGSWITRRLGRKSTLAIRSVLRKKGRLMVSLGLLAIGGGLFLATFNTTQAWKANLEMDFKTRHFDVTYRFSELVATDKVQGLIKGQFPEAQVEPWGMTPVFKANDIGYEVGRTYPDEGHGSFTLIGKPQGSTFKDPPLLMGRDLAQSGELVLNQSAKNLFPDKKIGDTIGLMADGHRQEYKLVGVIKEIGPSAAIILESDFEGTWTTGSTSRQFYVKYPETSPEEKKQCIASNILTLQNAGLPLSQTMAEADFQGAITDHILVLLFSLIAMAVMMGIVGVISLSSSLSLSVLERKREIGIMRAIGASNGVVFFNFLLEALFVAVLGIIGAIILSIPFSLGLGNLLGTMVFLIPLPLTIDIPGIMMLIPLLLTAGTLSALAPARGAMKLSVKDTIAYE